MDVTMAVQAFKMGLQRDSSFYQELVMNPCRNLDEVRNRALRFIRLEDNKKLQERIETSSRYNDPNRKSTSTYEPYKHEPYARPDNKKFNVVEDDDKEDCHKRLDYCCFVDVSGLMYAMKDLGDKARWPKKDNKSGWKDKSKWHVFHEDFGHDT